MKSSKAEFQDEDVQHQNPLPIVPLIDCFVLILVFFLATASVTKPHKELQISLPLSDAGIQTVSKHSTLIIEVTKDGQFYLDQEPHSKTLLHKKLRELYRTGPDRHVRIESDRSCAFQHIVHLMDSLKFEGFKDIGFRNKD